MFHGIYRQGRNQSGRNGVLRTATGRDDIGASVETDSAEEEREAKGKKTQTVLISLHFANIIALSGKKMLFIPLPLPG
jgi:hypothetical protein